MLLVPNLCINWIDLGMGSKKKFKERKQSSKPSLYEAGLLLLLSAVPQRIGLQRSAGQLVRVYRCGNCVECARKDCGKCANCSDKLKFGGVGKRKQACLQRQCLRPTL